MIYLKTTVNNGVVWVGLVGILLLMSISFLLDLCISFNFQLFSIRCNMKTIFLGYVTSSFPSLVMYYFTLDIAQLQGNGIN